MKRRVFTMTSGRHGKTRENRPSRKETRSMLSVQNFSCSYVRSSHATSSKRIYLFVGGIHQNTCVILYFKLTYLGRMMSILSTKASPTHIFVTWIGRKNAWFPVFWCRWRNHLIFQHTWKAQKPMKLTIGSVWSGRNSDLRGKVRRYFLGFQFTIEFIVHIRN